MSDENVPEGDGRARAWIFGTTALAAWFALLWFMFGDVL